MLQFLIELNFEKNKTKILPQCYNLWFSCWYLSSSESSAGGITAWAMQFGLTKFLSFLWTLCVITFHWFIIFVVNSWVKSLWKNFLLKKLNKFGNICFPYVRCPTFSIKYYKVSHGKAPASRERLCTPLEILKFSTNKCNRYLATVIEFSFGPTPLSSKKRALKEFWTFCTRKWHSYVSGMLSRCKTEFHGRGRSQTLNLVTEKQ